MTFRKQQVTLVGLAATALAVSGCGPSLIARSQGLGESSVGVQVLPAVDKKAPVNQPIVIVAENGSLADVQVDGPNGPLKGTYDESRSKWTSKATSLDFGATYSVQATATDGSGAPVTTSKTFKTINPDHLVDLTTVSVADGATVGVGMPISLTFSEPVQDKKNVEEQVSVASETPVVGAWAWQADDRLVFRPKNYWPAHNKVQVNLPLKGVKTGPGAYGAENQTIDFKTGNSMISVVNAATHQMKVEKNGKVVRTIPITTGKPGFETRSGIKVISEKVPFIIMDAASGGTPETSSEYYRLPVNWAMRVTTSGEFVHAAPWSVGSQGYSNVSHGCVGMSTDNAYWYYNQSRVGDIVEVKNTGRPQDLGNGITEWNESWKQWLKKSKTGPERTEPLTTGGSAGSDQETQVQQG